jgi:hypothetical protein
MDKMLKIGKSEAQSSSFGVQGIPIKDGGRDFFKVKGLIQGGNIFTTGKRSKLKIAKSENP